MRKVIVYKWVLNDKRQHDRVEDGVASFHAWGLDCDVGSYSAAIVERDDGTVELVNTDMIKFIS